MIGRRLSHYRVVERLGAGGMGEVYRAEDLSLKRQVALKILPEQLAGRPRRLERFRREAECVAALNHPNIVTVFSADEDQGVHFITMELVEGRRLADLISKGGLPLESYFSIAVPLVDAVSAAHQEGVIHRDLKPGNVMVTDKGVVKVMDFGLAKLLPAGEAAPEDETKAALTQDGGLLGTVPYMAPEQVRGAEVDHRSDIFALGVVLHEMASGERLFSGSSSADVLSAILRDEPGDITELRPDLPFHLGRIVRHCLEKDPDRRFQSALDLRYELEDLSREVATGVVRTSTVAESVPSRPPGRRRRRRAAGLALALVVMLALVGAAVWKLALSGESLPGGATYDSLAVLPFANLTGQPAQEYLGDGIALAVITRLSEVAELRVASQAETWSYREEELSSKQLGRRLGVDLLLKGDVQQTGEDLVVNTRLEETRQGTVLWGKSFERPQQELIALQREIAASLTAVLDVPLSIRERLRLAKEPTRSFRAYDFYLQGEQFLQAVEDARGPDLAAEIFAKALELDPDFALAHVGLSEALWAAHKRDGVAEVLRQAEHHAERAIALDPDLPAAQVAVARIQRSTGRFGESIAELRQVLARHPAPDEALRELAFSYERVGRIEDAEHSLRQAVALEPERWLNWNALGASLLEQGEYEEAREAFAEAARRSPPDITWPRENLALVALYEGDFASAIEEFEAIGGETDDPLLASNMSTAYFYIGRLDEAEEYSRLAVRLSPGNHELHWGLGDVLAERSEVERARAEYMAALTLVEDSLRVTPEDAELALTWAFYAAKAADCAGALTRLESLAAELQPTGPNVHRQGQVYALCDRKQEAVRAVEEAIRLGEPRELIREEAEFRSLLEEPEFLRVTGSG